MTLLYSACHMRGITMDRDDYDYFTISVKESVSLIFWTAFISFSAVGLLLLAAL
jgi:hypothetical protein